MSQSTADVLGPAQNCAIVTENSLGLSKDLPVTMQSKPDPASPWDWLFSIPGLWGCSLQVSRVHPANIFQLHVAQTQTSMNCTKKPWNLQTRGGKYLIVRAKDGLLWWKSYSCISVCFVLGWLFASGVYFGPIPCQVRAATILKPPLCHL